MLIQKLAQSVVSQSRKLMDVIGWLAVIADMVSAGYALEMQLLILDVLGIMLVNVITLIKFVQREERLFLIKEAT